MLKHESNIVYVAKKENTILLLLHYSYGTHGNKTMIHGEVDGLPFVCEYTMYFQLIIETFWEKIGDF